MEAATPLHRPQVRTQGERLVIDALVVADPCAVRLAQERERAGDDPAQLVLDAVEIGARVLDREHAAVQTDFVRAEFERQAREVESSFTEQARKVADALSRRLDLVFEPDQGQLAKSLGQHFDEGSTGAVQHRVRALVEQANREAHSELQRTFASDSGLLADFKRGVLAQLADQSRRQDLQLRGLSENQSALQRELQGLREEKQRLEEVAAERDKGTAKGRSYEEALVLVLDEIACAHGDVCEGVGDVAGALGKKGDVVVDIDACAGPARGRVVWEAKDKQLTRPKAMTELSEALVGRSADFAVLVVPTEDEVPARLGSLREYDGDKLVVAWHPEEGSRLPLELAYKLARARVLLTRSSADGLDADALRAEIGRAVCAMDEVRKIRLALTGATKQLGSAQDLLVELEKRVRAHLAAVDGLLAGAVEG